MEQFVIRSPMRAKISKNKLVAMNLNRFRTLHFHSKNAMKRNYSEIIMPLLPKVTIDKCEIHAIIYSKDRRKRDLDNAIIVIKFFNDCLVAKGIIEDDNYNIVKRIILDYGGRKDEEYMDITVKEIE